MKPEAEKTSFRALEQVRAFEQIFVQIAEAISSGSLGPGDRLPSERELAETFGVSRASVREALRALEMFGAVEATRGTGPNGGSVVVSSIQTGLGNVLRLHTSLLKIPTGDIVDVRAALESRAAHQAAVNASDADIARLHALIDAMRVAKDITDYHGLDTEFHVEIARVSGNALLPLLMEALRDVVRRDMIGGFAALDDWTVARRGLVAEHTQIVELIEAREPEAAAAAVRDHISGFYRQVIEGRPTHIDAAAGLTHEDPRQELRH